MSNLVEINNGEPMASSRVVADFFGKSHKHVLDSARKLMRELDSDSREFGHENFKESTYTTERGKTYKNVLMTKDGFALLAMGFTGSKANQWKIKFLQAFNEMQQGFESFDIRARHLHVEGSKLKKAGREWSELGHEIRRKKKCHNNNVKKLIGDVQFKLDF